MASNHLLASNRIGKRPSMSTLSIHDISVEMQKVIALRDPELLHAAADKLLVQLTRKLANDRSDKQQIEQILQTWEALPKWYS
jgi:hypothetical protein